MGPTIVLGSSQNRPKHHSSCPLLTFEFYKYQTPRPSLLRVQRSGRRNTKQPLFLQHRLFTTTLGNTHQITWFNIIISYLDPCIGVIDSFWFFLLRLLLALVIWNFCLNVVHVCESLCFCCLYLVRFEREIAKKGLSVLTFDRDPIRKLICLRFHIFPFIVIVFKSLMV